MEHPFLLLEVYLSTEESLSRRAGWRMQSADPRPSGWPDIWAGWWKRRWWVFVRVFWQLKMLQGWFKGQCRAAVMALWGVDVKVCMCSFGLVYIERNSGVSAVQWSSSHQNYRNILWYKRWRNDCLWSLRGALTGWVHRWSTKGQVGDEDAADGRQPWGLDEWPKKQRWLLRLWHGLTVNLSHTYILYVGQCCDFVHIAVAMYIKRPLHSSWLYTVGWCTRFRWMSTTMLYFACKRSSFILVQLVKLLSDWTTVLLVVFTAAYCVVGLFMCIS